MRNWRWANDLSPHQNVHLSTGQEWVLNSADIAKWRTEQAIINAVADTSKADAEELKRRTAQTETKYLSDVDSSKWLNK